MPHVLKWHECTVHWWRYFRGEGGEGGGSSSRRETVSLLSGIASALTGLATPFVVRSLGMTSTEAADPELVGPLHGVRCMCVLIGEERYWSSLIGGDWSCSVVGGGELRISLGCLWSDSLFVSFFRLFWCHWPTNWSLLCDWLIDHLFWCDWPTNWSL